MSTGLLIAVENHRNAKKRGRPCAFIFQHKLYHDFESLIWVIVYAMMVRRKTELAATDSSGYDDYKEHLDSFWGVHSYTKLVNSHEALIGAGVIRTRFIVEELLFSDPLEAEFFRAAMRLVRSQVHDEEPITYEKMQSLFQTYIQKAAQTNVSTLAST